MVSNEYEFGYSLKKRLRHFPHACNFFMLQICIEQMAAAALFYETVLIQQNNHLKNEKHRTFHGAI